jgi:hypothetical protein
VTRPEAERAVFFHRSLLIRRRRLDQEQAEVNKSLAADGSRYHQALVEYPDLASGNHENPNGQSDVAT